MMQATQPELYMNMRQFSDLKLQARQDSAQASKAVSEQFEGLFIQMMLKNMRSAAIMDESQHSSYVDFYTDMYDKQISLMLSQQGGIGIAKMMQQQIGQYLSEGKNSATEAGNELPVYRLPEERLSHHSNELPVPQMNYMALNPAVKTHQLNPLLSDNSVNKVDATDEAAPTALISQTIEPFYGWQRAETFVKDLWPHAQKAAEQLGVSTQVLVAQSALETGWGKHVMKNPDGTVAFNLFGIKAGSDWVGQSVTHRTVEFRDGSMQRETARFRAYDSVSDALDDYVSFVKTRPRYAQALQHDGNDVHYVTGLQQAGYATDPDYARKISNIMQGQTLHQALSGVAASQQTSNEPMLS